MHLRRLLNERHPIKGFVYEKCEMIQEKGEVIVHIRPRSNSMATCSGCGKKRPGYDTIPGKRRFEFIPIWGLQVFFVYLMRRVNCPVCGIHVEKLPWAEGKQQKCNAFMAFLASWAEDLPWKRVAERFRSSWQTVYKAVNWVVDYGLEHRDLEGVSAIGVDEVQYKKGQNYLTLVYQIDEHCRRLLWVGKERTKESFAAFFTDMELRLPGFCASIQFVCSDMWKAYLTVISIAIPQALHVLDRFHIRGKFSEAVDKVRRQEVARLKGEGKDPVLKKSRWCFLKNRHNLTGNQKGLLKTLLNMNLKTVRAYLLAEDFEHFWTYNSVTWAKKFLKSWTKRAMYSRIEPMKAVARMLRNHEELILNWFRAKKEINNGITEGLNLNVKLAMRKARGFRSVDIAKIALFHQMGRLPKPKFHRKLW